MHDIISRAEARKKIAEHILLELDLINRWSRYGTCILVGAVAYGLVVTADIDIEIFCPKLKIDDGFDVLRACALHPNLTKTRFWNALGPPHYGLYWQVRYAHNGEEWKIDMWSVEDTYEGPCGSRIIEAMDEALTDESRRAILALKESVMKDPTLECPSIQVYRAVLDHSIRTCEELMEWLPKNPLTEVVTDWYPGKFT